MSQVEVPRQSGQADLALGTVTIPDPAYIHGRITDSAGNVVPGGVLQIFELQTDTQLVRDREQRADHELRGPRDRARQRHRGRRRQDAPDVAASVAVGVFDPP